MIKYIHFVIPVISMLFSSIAVVYNMPCTRVVVQFSLYTLVPKFLLSFIVIVTVIYSKSVFLCISIMIKQHWYRLCLSEAIPQTVLTVLHVLITCIIGTAVWNVVAIKDMRWHSLTYLGSICQSKNTGPLLVGFVTSMNHTIICYYIYSNNTR